jgi:signal transduction histidine kinase
MPRLAGKDDDKAPAYASPWRDTLAVLIATGLAVALSAHFNWSEALYALTRREERLQVDELPLGALVLLVGLIWLAWRRNRQARREIGARCLAEARLEEALAANRELSKETLRIQEIDRKHLALELHDELGQYLNAIKLDAASIRDGSARGARGPVETSDAIVRTVDHLHGIVGQMIARLRPVALDELGLLAAIEHGIDEWRLRLPDTQFSFDAEGCFDGLGEALNLTAYRLIQEGLTNIYKHAKAPHVRISLSRSTDGTRGVLCVSVADDGGGVDLSKGTAGHGLNGMRERTELSGGTFFIDSAPGRGLRFEARLPIPEVSLIRRQDAHRA